MMRLRTHVVVALAVLLLPALFAGPAAAQPPGLPDLSDLPPGVDVEDIIAEYTDVLPEVLDAVDDVEDIAAVDEEAVEAAEAEEEVAVRGITEERLPVTGGDIFGIAVVGLVLVGLGFLAVRRGRGVTDVG